MNHNLDDIKLLLFIGISGMLALFTGFLLLFIFAQRKKYELQKRILILKEDQSNQLIEAAVRSEEKERLRIAEALHDEVGAYLSSARLYLQALDISPANKQNQLLKEKSRELIDEAVAKVRGISHNLHSGILQQLGLNEAIRHFTEKLMLESHLEIVTSLKDTEIVSDQESRVNIFRLVQELLNNIIKHAGASHVSIFSAIHDQVLSIGMLHDGHGLEQSDFERLKFSAKGLGIKNIQNRMILLRGSISLFQENGNYHIRIDIPNKALQHD